MYTYYIRICIELYYDVILYEANSVPLQNQLNFRIGVMGMYMGRRHNPITMSVKVLLNGNFINFPVQNIIKYYITENSFLYFRKSTLTVNSRPTSC